MCMGEIYRFRSVKIVINSNDHIPPHVHVLHAGRLAKIEIESLKIISNKGYSPKE